MDDTLERKIYTSAFSRYLKCGRLHKPTAYAIIVRARVFLIPCDCDDTNTIIANQDLTNCVGEIFM